MVVYVWLCLVGSFQPGTGTTSAPRRRQGTEEGAPRTGGEHVAKAQRLRGSQAMQLPSPLIDEADEAGPQNTPKPPSIVHLREGVSWGFNIALKTNRRKFVEITTGYFIYVKKQ